MPSLAEQYKGLIGDLWTGKVSDERFFEEFATTREDVVAFGLGVLRQALVDRDATLVEFGVYVAHRFGVTSEHLFMLMELCAAPWHVDHENVVSALSKLRDPRAADVLYRTALAQFPYLAYDDTYSLGVKCIWGLSGIATEPALELLGQLAHSGNEVFERSAVQQLTRVFVKPPSEAVRALAGRLLERKELVAGILENAHDNYDAHLLAFGLSVGRRLGFDKASIESLSELARGGFDEGRSEALVALSGIDSDAAVIALSELLDEPTLRDEASRALTKMSNDTNLSEAVRDRAGRACSNARAATSE